MENYDVAKVNQFMFFQVGLVILWKMVFFWGKEISPRENQLCVQMLLELGLLDVAGTGPSAKRSLVPATPTATSLSLYYISLADPA